MAAPVEEDAVTYLQQQLKERNEEAQRLEATLNLVYEDLRAPQPAEVRATFQRRVDNLEDSKKRVDKMRNDLQSQLAAVAAAQAAAAQAAAAQAAAVQAAAAQAAAAQAAAAQAETAQAAPAGTSVIHEVLASALPKTADHTTSSSKYSSSSRPEQYWKPTVMPWQHVDPADPTSGRLEEAILEFQRNPPVDGAGMSKIPTCLAWSVGNEEGVRTAWASILNLVPILPSTSEVYWAVEVTDRLIQGNPPGAVSEPLTSAAAARDSTSRLRQDLVLSVPLPHDQPTSSASPPRKRRAVCIGELKAINKLSDRDTQAALDLVALCKQAADHDEQDSLLAAVSAVHQLYTYLAANCVQYGFLSNWHHTWLARLVPENVEEWPWLGKLYLSSPIASTAASTAANQQVTAISGQSWLHYTAVKEGLRLPYPTRRRSSPVPRGPAGGGAANQPAPPDQPGPGASKDSSSQAADDSNDRSWHPSQTGPASDSYQLLAGHSVVWVATKPNPGVVQNAASPAPSPGVLRFEQHLCDGLHGAVFNGTLDGQPAVIKMLGPSSEGVAALHREQTALRFLATANVQATSKLLGVGKLHLGVCFLATALVQGKPLSQVQPLAADVAEAALAALSQVHAAHPTLLHGDLRLENILLLTQAASNSLSTAPQCKLIDFGEASFEGSPARQDKEMRQLRQLLQAAAERPQS